ncbi:MAG TPA: T9SS type A sorting domain-containing protein [Niastella sp.]
MYKQFYSIGALVTCLLLSCGVATSVTAQTVELTRRNISSGGGGGTALIGNELRYRITVTNNTSANFTNSVVYGNIPAGTSYVAGTTKINGVSVPDVNTKMPFGSGGLINSSSYGPGVVAPGTTVEVEFFAKVSTTMGDIIATATFKATTTSGEIVIKANTDPTSVTGSAQCDIIYQSTTQINSGAPSTYLNRYIKLLNTDNGTAGTTYITGTAGSPLVDAEAIAYDRSSNRLFFINGTSNNPAQDLCYVGYNGGVFGAYKYVGYPLETNTATDYNIDRMTNAADGYCYALTTNAQDLIRFSVANQTNALPVITPLGPLVNDANNGANDVLAERGGDMFADASGRLFLIPNSGKLYMINPATRVATYLGTITGLPGSVTGVAVDLAGDIYVGGAYSFVYRVNFATMTAVQLNATTSNVWKTGDYASCALPIIAPVLNATKTYTNVNGFDPIRAGDPIEYTIEVTNTGNLFATAAKLFDAIPANSSYILNSTTVNGIAVADIGGAMPFSVSGGQLISSSGAAAGIVKPGVANKVVIKFRVETAEYKTVCNQATISYPDSYDNLIHVFSDDPAQSGEVDPTCLYSGQGLISMSATKTYFNTTTGHIGDIAGDPMEYTIVVSNSGLNNATNVKLYDAIPAFGHYIAGTTTMNGVTVDDVGGLMPFSVSGGEFVNSPGQMAGVVAPGDANKVVIKFRITSDVLKTICNQATIYYPGANGDTKNVITDDPTKPGAQDATCYWSDGIVGTGRVAVTTSSKENQPVPAVMEKIEVKPNPFVNNLNLQVQLNTSEKVQIRLIDFYGRTVYTTSRNVSAGVSLLNVSVPEGLSSGMYVLELSAGSRRLVSKKLIKQ